jgi:hypothetical protein
LTRSVANDLGADNDLLIPYTLRLLAGDDDLVNEVNGAILRDGFWEQFVELRMAAGPTLRIEGGSSNDTFRVEVQWGAQHAVTEVRGVNGAIEVADRLGWTFYEIRRDGPSQVD